MEFCAEGGLCVDNTYFKHRSLHKYARVSRSQVGVEVKSLIDLVLVQKDMLCFIQDVRAVKGMRRDLSDHHMVLSKVRLVAAWITKREVVVEGRWIRREKQRVSVQRRT